MANRIARVLIAIFGAALGPALVAGVVRLLSVLELFSFEERLTIFAQVAIYIVSAIGMGIFFYVISVAIINAFKNLLQYIEHQLNEIPAMDIVFGTAGLIIGLIIAFLLSGLAEQIQLPWLSTFIMVVIYLICGILGWTIARKRRNEFNLPAAFRRTGKGDKHNRSDKHAAPRPKVLDTSVIIDGRIFDICKTGIVEGTLIIPGFVLQELRHIADSADGLKRNRGRRGLDILNRIQKELDIVVRVEEKDYDDIAEVDAKLLRLAQEIGGVVVTNDYNLNKVAAVQDVPVLNINELANAVKPVVLPGEEMLVNVVKDGKEHGQGVAYLDDGTMIVVDGGKRHMGEEVEVIVTSVLQTAAGRMIFARLKNEY